MPDLVEPGALVAQARRFSVRLPDDTQLRGVQFPSGRIVCDSPTGLTVAPSMEHLIGPLNVSRVEWVPDAFEHVISDDGQTCLAAARRRIAAQIRASNWPASACLDTIDLVADTIERDDRPRTGADPCDNPRCRHRRDHHRSGFATDRCEFGGGKDRCGCTGFQEDNRD